MVHGMYSTWLFLALVLGNGITELDPGFMKVFNLITASVKA
jgi:hypothetical protein